MSELFLKTFNTPSLSIFDFKVVLVTMLIDWE